jgi:outer membrane biosynthesis protein TonB
MQRSLLISVALHCAVLLILWLGLPAFLPPIPPMTQIVPVEIADVGAITNTRIKQQPAPPKPQPQPPKPVEQPKPQPKPPEAAPTPPQQAVPPPPEQEPEALPEKPVEVKKPEPKKPEPKKPVEDTKPKPDMLASVLKNVAQIKQKSAPKAQKPMPKTEEDDSEPDNEAPALADHLSVSEEDALRRQIGSCWNVPIGARNAEELVVQVLITVNPDRTVQSVKVVDSMRMATDSFFRAAAESAVRALRHPLCSPLALPPEKYEEWKVIRFNFDPRDML